MLNENMSRDANAPCVAATSAGSNLCSFSIHISLVWSLATTEWCEMIWVSSRRKRLPFSPRPASCQTIGRSGSQNVELIIIIIIINVALTAVRHGVWTLRSYNFFAALFSLNCIHNLIFKSLTDEDLRFAHTPAPRSLL